MQQLLTEMSEQARRYAGGTARVTITPSASVLVSESVTGPIPTVYEPMLCLVLQGAKHVMIGDRMLRYDPASFFIASVELPVCGQIVEASSERPYICATLLLDRDLLASLIPAVPVQPDGEIAGFGVSPVTQKMLEPWSRMLALLDAPEDIPVLAPLLEREILYRLLQGPQGGALRQIARADSRLSQVRRSMEWIRMHFDKAIRIETLAELAGMSPASFHRHFKAATAMSPLQYQKTLRLQEARRLMVVSASTTQAAHRVGYESASQFSREYARMFGVPPSRDAGRLRGQRIDLGEATGVA